MEGSDSIIIITAVFLSISLIAVGLRCFVRLKIVKAFGYDDALMVMATIFNVGFATCGIVGAVYGMGKSQAYLAHRPEDFRRGLLCWWLGQILYIFTCTIARLSIAITLLRLTVVYIHLWVLYGVMWFSTTVGIVFLFFTIFQCHPVAYYWNHSSLGGHCLDINTLLGIVYMYSGVAAACDFTIGTLPAVMIWGLQMDRRTKIAVSGILGIASVFVHSACPSHLGLVLTENFSSASTAVIVRIPFLHFARDPDFLREPTPKPTPSLSLHSVDSNLASDATTQISIWSNIEANLGITAGSLATIRPLLRVLSTRNSFTQRQQFRGSLSNPEESRY